MQLTNIKESGTNNILMWAIANGADIKNDPALQSIIRDELSYIVTISDINFFELFRLTQLYRDRLRIIDEKQAEMPTRSELHKLFNGVYKVDLEDRSKDIQLSELVEYCGDMFINLAMQMNVDDDIISPSTVRMFLPMISRKFTIQIPVEFTDILNSMSEDESNQIYNNDYPNTLNTIIESDTHGVKTALQLAIIRATSIIKYNKQYDKYVKIIKYNPLKTCINNKLYKFSLLGFYKRDNVSRGEIRIDLFNPNRENMTNALHYMSKINSPLKLEFAIQLPIQYMQMLENSFSDDLLTIAYESSMSNIIDSGLIFDDFITSDYDEESEDETERTKAIEHNNEISAYKVRITEANQRTLNAMPILLSSEGDVDVTSVFSMLPSIYTTRAVIRIDMNNKPLTHYDPIIDEMFKEIYKVSYSIIEDINKAK